MLKDVFIPAVNPARYRTLCDLTPVEVAALDRLGEGLSVFGGKLSNTFRALVTGGYGGIHNIDGTGHIVLRFKLYHNTEPNLYRREPMIHVLYGLHARTELQDMPFHVAFSPAYRPGAVPSDETYYLAPHIIKASADLKEIKSPKILELARYILDQKKQTHTAAQPKP